MPINRSALVALILWINLLAVSTGYENSIFYCGFSGDYCGQSTTNDIHPSINTIILAFANTAPDGRIVIDEDNYPAAFVEQWKRSGKSVVISVGGQNGNWAYVFANDNSINTFIHSLFNAVQKYRLDGVDLDIESYLVPPRTVANMIIKLKQKLNTLGSKLLIVSP